MEMLIQLLTRFGDKNGWSSYVTYSALGLMVAVSLWDIFSPANKRCDDDSCAV
ncbi:hypothetical protein AB8F75_23525 [Salmonella enterica]|uniref:hypothetical protein n=1 Tax=Enterobacteriaceae TaxID=543 RepID=UPI0003591ABB|nr:MULTISPECIES: hypothetical protein [Enterobacteriaceae]AGQ71085.1 hypothetical protein CFSAN001921_23945 [Salmonella enterica subsp. enterica serovar Typhimurium var. 5- str. CFSAN001921]MCI4009701.1 hypothetical protein [Salmonella enterica subsp. enterica serovar Heidelberg]MCI4023476.1 hypothetical protein [Salmonella enterica subsp. enterica serovar Heidelberg]MCI4027749.1 hypothetical protein [Salmonella enterica subsp. enterica serovar Heidelberg]MCI4089770.1 hypothetical protein [Sal